MAILPNSDSDICDMALGVNNTISRYQLTDFANAGYVILLDFGVEQV